MRLFPVIIITSLLASPQILHAAPQTAAKPNIVLILGDDMAIDSVSAYNDQLGLKTPHLDQLASEGISFMDAHSTSGVCSPSRYSVLTGRYHWRSRLKRGIVGKWERPLIKNSRLTLPEMLRVQGYATACIGKWHLGWHWPKKGGGTTEKFTEIDFTKPVKGGPIDHGFDYYYGDDVPNWPPYAWRENDKIIGPLDSTMNAGSMVGVSSGPSVKDWDFSAVLPEYARRCSKYIHGRKGKTQPFFLFFPMPSPHTPIAPDKTWQGKSGVSEYADFLLETDWVVGQVLKAIKDSGQEDNTIVIFTCDNGTSPKCDFAGLEKKNVNLRHHWRGNKADVYEGGHRVPFIVKWKNHAIAGSRTNETITHTDIMRTLAEATQGKLPETAAVDSVSLIPAIKKQVRTHPLHDIVINQSGSGYFAVRKGPWKLLLCRGSGGWSEPKEAAAAKKGLPKVQLYNLEQDPKEQKNLQAQYPEKVQQLTAALRSSIEAGRSTPGTTKLDDDDTTWWKGLPWTAK